MLTRESLSRLNTLLFAGVAVLGTAVLNLGISKGSDPHDWAAQPSTPHCESIIDMLKQCPTGFTAA